MPGSNSGLMPALRVVTRTALAPIRRRHPDARRLLAGSRAGSHWLAILSFSLVVAGRRVAPAVGEGGQSRPLCEVLGVTHIGGKYCLTDQDYLNEGADQILALGSRTIKLWFIHPEREYPFHSEWTGYTSLVELAQTPYFRSVFSKPFKTYILVAYSLGRFEHYWRQGLTEDQRRDETRQFYELSRHLLTAYKGTGKTFVLQHWEGDWAIRTAYDPDQEPTPRAIEGMTGWLNARQAGVDRARAELPDAGAYVYHAAEVNLVAKAMLDGKPNVVNRVLPQTPLDLVSYSCWDTLAEAELFPKALDYLAAQMPDSDAFGSQNVYIGEYGFPENEVPPERHRAVIRNVVDSALKWGCPYLVYWELYCNEARRQPVTRNEDCRGVWLIRPDGSRSWVWDYLREKMGYPASRP